MMPSDAAQAYANDSAKPGSDPSNSFNPEAKAADSLSTKNAITYSTSV